MTMDPKSHILYMSKDIDSIISTECPCSTIVSDVKDILDHKGYTDGNIVDIDDIIDVIDYNSPRGKNIGQLDDAYKILDNDIFLISQLEPSEDQEVSNFVSKKITYSDLRRQLLEDIICGLGVKSMAFEDKRDYSLTSHNHDEIYNRVEWKPNPLYYGPKKSQVSNLGQVVVDFETLTSCDVSSNPAMSQLSTTSAYIYCPKFYGPKFCSPLPSRPLVNTLKFIASPTIRKLLDSNQLSTYSYRDGGLINVNPYGSDGKIRPDYDGWMFPNGATIQNIENQLSDAAKVFAGDWSAKQFTLPTISNFIYAFSQERSPDSKLSSFSPQVGNVKADNVVVGPENESLNRAKTVDSVTESQDPYPIHDLIPLMIYVGGETLEYYKNP